MENIKIGAKLGLLNPKNGRYKYSTIEKIEGEDVFLVEKHPTRSQWDNHWQTTKINIKKFLNEDNRDFKNRKSYVLKYARGGALQSYTTTELAADLGISKKQMEVNKYDRDDLIALAEQQGLIKSNNNKTCYTIGGL